MASGHVNRTQRPNTWLHRPTLRREDSPCQLGAVHTWPLTDMPIALAHVRFEGEERKWRGLAALSQFDPLRKWSVASQQSRMLA